MQRFVDKVALVTGAASGIGRATAERLAGEGARVVAADLNLDGLASLAETLKQRGAECHTVALDVSDSAACDAAVAAAVETFGGLDVLCNVAGIFLARHFTELSDSDWRKVMGINTDGVFYMCRAAVPELLKRGGNIVNISSTAGMTGQAYNAVYCASKAAVVMLTQTLAMEFGKQGMRANVVCPGGVKTPLTASLSFPADADVQLLQRLYPLVDSAEPEEIAAAVAYLGSSEARFVNGTVFAIDGGQTAG